MAIKLELSVKFNTLTGSKVVKETFSFRRLKKEDIDENFLNDLVIASIKKGDMTKYDVDENEYIFLDDVHNNELNICHDDLIETLTGWKILRTKTKVKNIKEKEILTANSIITKLKDYYEVTTISDLSNKLGNITQSNISRAIKNDNVKLLVAKIREAGLYEEILKELK